jgi:gluconate 2-dehydrogenase gamma chain
VAGRALSPIDPATYAPVTLSADELTAVKAILARLIPADELGPGAVEAGVHVYVDQELGGFYAGMLPTYQAQLAALDVAAVKRGGSSFAELAEAEQDALLTEMEAGELGEEAMTFFQTLLTHTAEGMFGDPVYGGNADFAGWDLLGFPGIKLVWAAEEQAIDTVVEPEHLSVADFGGSAYR